MAIDQEIEFNAPNSAWNLAIKQGAIWGLLAIIIQLSLYLTVGVDHTGMSASTIFSSGASVVLAIAMLYVVQKAHRDQNLSGQISFGDAFKVGLMCTLVYAGIFILYNFIFTTFIEPDLTAEVFELQLEEMEDRGSSEEEIAMTKKIFSFFYNPVSMLLVSFVYLIARGALFSLFTAFAVQKERN